MSRFCTQCGKEIADDAQFCHFCGSRQMPVQSSASSSTSSSSSSPAGETAGANDGNQAGGNQANSNSQWANFNYQPPTGGAQEVFSPEDIQANRVFAGLAYFIFFLPLIVHPESRYGRFHANQGLVLLIASVVGSIIAGAIPFLNVVLVPLFSIAIFVYSIMGLINGLNGQARELPLVGKWRIIK